MSVEALINDAFARGVKLALVDGQLKYYGVRAAVNEMLEPLRLHKAEIICWMQAANERCRVAVQAPERTAHGLAGWNVHIPCGTSQATIAKFRSASLALDAAIVASGGSLELDPYRHCSGSEFGGNH